MVKEERLQILRMIREGTISAEEGAELLAALRAGTDLEASGPHESGPAGRLARKWLRIRVTDKRNDQVRVNVTLPLGLLNWGLKMAESTSGINLVAVKEVIRGGATGKILEVDESESGERVEIFVE